jgi:hypothetical protein
MGARERTEVVFDVPVRLSKQEFDAYPSYKGAAFWLEERAWFKMGLTLGTVILDHADNDWGFVVRRPDENKAGLYCAVDVGTSFPTKDEATEMLEAAMVLAEALELVPA